MAQNNSNIHRYDFIIGIIIMVVVILIAIALSGNSWSPTTGNTPDSGTGACDNSVADAGC